MPNHLWEADHPYYCTESNYFKNGLFQPYDSLAGFLEDWETADPDHNLLFRWDWYQADEDTPTDRLYCFWIKQRKGIFMATACPVTKDDETRVLQFLRPRWLHMVELWSPLPEVFDA